MEPPAIQVERLGKRYRLGTAAPLTRTLGEVVHALLRRRVRPEPDRPTAAAREHFWALRDLNLSIAPGEVVGLIGRNGAGKSTLLKILARVVYPTTGRALIRGRVGSLLEVGTGFHPELTGRENIFLNGALLGMRRAEVRARFDEIVAFAEVDRFLDTPVKRYSSGMYVRLAFAVAAHLDPDILIVDEVLAVGDAAFQRKCLGRMGEVAGHGRTVLFVSHNMTAVRNLCTRAVWLDAGRAVRDGEPAAVIQAYLGRHATADTCPDMDLRDWPLRRGAGGARLLRARLLDACGRVCGRFTRLGPLTLELEFESRTGDALNLSAAVTTVEDGLKVLQLAHQDSPGFEPGVVLGRRTVRVEIDRLPLQCGIYQWMLCLHTAALNPLDVVQDVLRFTVEDDLARSPRPFRSTREHGLCSLPAVWRYVPAAEPAYAVQ